MRPAYAYFSHDFSMRPAYTCFSLFTCIHQFRLSDLPNSIFTGSRMKVGGRPRNGRATTSNKEPLIFFWYSYCNFFTGRLSGPFFLPWYRDPLLFHLTNLVLIRKLIRKLLFKILQDIILFYIFSFLKLLYPKIPYNNYLGLKDGKLLFVKTISVWEFMIMKQLCSPFLPSAVEYKFCRFEAYFFFLSWEVVIVISLAFLPKLIMMVLVKIFRLFFLFFVDFLLPGLKYGFPVLGFANLYILKLLYPDFWRNCKNGVVHLIRV